jgi:hypothetical protein
MADNSKKTNSDSASHTTKNVRTEITAENVDTVLDKYFSSNTGHNATEALIEIKLALESIREAIEMNSRCLTSLTTQLVKMKYPSVKQPGPNYCDDEDDDADNKEEPVVAPKKGALKGNKPAVPLPRGN